MGNVMHSDTPWRSSIMLGICFFLLLCIFRYQVLFFPPYWDSITGLFAEAIWLNDHQFDYYKLMYETRILTRMAPGPTYFLSILHCRPS